MLKLPSTKIKKYFQLFRKIEIFSIPRNPLDSLNVNTEGHSHTALLHYNFKTEIMTYAKHYFGILWEFAAI